MSILGVAVTNFISHQIFQVVFEGDSLTLRCRAPRVAVGPPNDSEDLPTRTHLFWGWSETILEPNSTDDIFYGDPAKVFPSIQINARHLSDSGLFDSTLFIPYVTPNHSGTWDCRLRSEQAMLSRSIVVMILSEKTKYCSAIETKNNKGLYSWPQTMRGRTVRLPCQIDEHADALATHKCNEAGEWIGLDTSACPYVSETTKFLEQFANMNLTLVRASLVENAKRLRNFTDPAIGDNAFRDAMDVVFITRTLVNYLEYIGQERDLATILLDIISQTMRISQSLLQAAQVMDSSCSKIVRAAERCAEHVQPIYDAQKSNVALEVFRVQTDSFVGITCSWFRAEDKTDGSQKRIFQCNTGNNGQIGLYERHVDAVIQIPSNVYAGMPVTPDVVVPTGQTQKLQVSVFENGRLFPQNKTQTIFAVTSCVIGSNVSTVIENMTEPIYVMLRPAPFHDEISAPRPVWWDPQFNNGLGGWSLEGCNFSQVLHGLYVFTCDRLGYYGLLQNVKYLNDFPDENAGARFKFSPPAFYVGGIVLFLCSWINIVTYMAYGQSIQMARRAKHALINMWLALSTLSLIFTSGIYQTEHYKVCQGVGIAIHYFSLCVLLWICVSVRNMYNRLTRMARSTERNLSILSDELPKERSSNKPILGLYLVGWGIALIICGISGAVNIREYASYSLCFFESGPALGAVFVPTIVLICFLGIMFICIKCSMQIPDDVGHMSEGTQATENVDLDLLEPSLSNNHIAVGRYRSISLSLPTSSIQDDLEHSNGAQLKAHIIVTFLYLITWTSAAMSVSTPFSGQILYEEEVFSIIYAVSASLLGLFMLFFYCIARSDVRNQWSMLSCRNFSKKQCCRSRSISDAKEHNNGPIVTYHQTTTTLNSTSRSNSQCSKNRPPNNGNMMLKGPNDLNMHTLTRNSSPNEHGSKLGVTGAPNLNLVLLHRQQFLHNPMIGCSSDTAEIFYNPNQINVARKFFKKQKRLQKRNNFELQRQRDMETKSDVSSIMSFPRRQQLSIFSSGSKVNNTNIHIDRKNMMLENTFRKECIGASSSEVGGSSMHRQPNMNPNILSDSCNESDLVDTDRIIIGAESLRALTLNRQKVNNNAAAAAALVANIYTNIPETSQPQHEIVTMRADDKYGKQKPIFDESDDEDADDRTSLLAADEEEQQRRTEEQQKHAPIYVNNMELNGIAETSDVTDVTDITDVISIEEHSSLSPATCLEFRSSPSSKKDFVLSLNSPILAMNTIGLPSVSANDLTESSIEPGDLMKLDRNAEYISEALEITSNVHKSASPSPSAPILIRIRRTKSLNNLVISDDFSNPTMENQTRSISCTNMCLPTIEPIAHVPAAFYPSESPVLFSPSLCDLPDSVPSPSRSCDSQLPSVSRGGFAQRRINHESTPNGSESNLYFGPDKLFHLSLLRNFSSSPTAESDINYQNSELSIRSHDLYGPPELNELNLTLTDDQQRFFPYQASEISDLDDDDDNLMENVDYHNCSRDLLLGDDEDDILNESQSSIDELYQQITRRAINTNNGSDIPSISTAAKNDADEEDSSQSSVISFVDPLAENIV